MNPFFAIVRRDARLAFRQGTDTLMTLAFFVIAVVLFPFGVGPEPNVLARIGGGVVWVAALLASMLALERLFQADYEDGGLELLALAPMPLSAVALAKVLAHWLATGLPLAVAAPALGVMMNVPGDVFPVLIGALLLGTPTLSLIGAIGAGLILGARRGGVLLALLVLPLFIPVLVFGVSAVEMAAQGLSPAASLLILGGMFLAALALAPWATAAAIRQALE
ncbi:MAG: heme exporter protein CcmB [Alphaproteobacteria bacterium]|nr:heme exporter protein CcmB [Alphaproteobacteria bacterium]MBM3950021.1 heme exporter protein CcmB [Rhodospirillales bacterium]